MSSILIALSGLVAPGFAQGLMSQRRAMAIAIGLFAAAIAATLFVAWGVYLTLAVMLGAMVEAGLRHRRLSPNIAWSWRYALLAVGSALAISLVARAFVVEAFRIPSTSMVPTLEIGDHIVVDKLVMRWRAPRRGEVIVFRQPCMPDRDFVMRVVALEDDTVEIRCGVVHVNGAPVAATLVKVDDRYFDHQEGDDREYEKPASRYRETIGDHTFDVFHDIDRPKRDEARRAGTAEIRAEDKNFDFPRSELQTCANAGLGEGAPAPNQQPGKIVETDPSPADPCKPHRHYVVPKGHVWVMGDSRENSNDSRFWGPVPTENVKGPVIGIWLPFRRIGRLE